MTLDQFVIERIACGLIIGMILFVLRASIDRRKGFLVEVCGVSLPILVAAVVTLLLASQLDLMAYRKSIEPFVQIVFLALPILAAERIVARTQKREILQIADLFRITTVVSLATFIFTTLPERSSLVSVAIITSTYLASEYAARSHTRWRQLALVFSAAFIVAIISHATSGESVLNLLSPTRDFAISLRSNQGSIALLCMLLAVISVPWWASWLLLKSRPLHTWAWRLSALRFSFQDPADSIFSNLLFRLWHFRDGICYLNHGSFGAVPLWIRDHQATIRRECEDEPMDFLARQIEQRWLNARFQLATWLGSPAENIAFCENATAGMNEIAAWFPLEPGDEVLMNDHEYGAVRRIWKRRCEHTGSLLKNITLPRPFTDPQAICDAILSGCTSATKLVVVSHITSPTAVIMPVAKICQGLRERGIASCIDGPHALLQERFSLTRLGCDFYTASCHKWLCAPIGSGFVYVDPKWHKQVQPSRLSWGRVQPQLPENWTDELLWTGTRDSSPYLTVPKAIEFFDQFEYEQIDARNHELACYARRKLSKLPGAEPVTPEGREWFGWMVGVWLPEGDHWQLQQNLFTKFGIEVPIVYFGDRFLVRVSCHLYTSTEDIDFLVRALIRELESDRQ